MRFKTSFTVRVQSSDPRSTGPAPLAGETEKLFQPAAGRYQGRLSKAAVSAVAGALLSGLSLLVPEALLKWVAIPGVGLIGLSLLLFFTLPALSCPSCGKETGNGFGTFCPACGSGNLQVNRLWGTRCDACGRSLGSYKYRNYPVRYCTHCGTLLHAAGV
ncbi:MAG TPA: hypothetical protein VGZ27_11390 [Vicinamibacterales bacterium]|jgi:hypothetical protein|nr:hypothetical protein [Vicinamibacterales bacterium]